LRERLRIGMAQINPTLGDFEGNSGKITDFIIESVKKDVDLIIFPELAITGYPPQDLIFNKCFIDKNIEVLNKIAADIPAGIAAVVGFIDKSEGGLYDAAAVIQSGRVVAKRYKTLLPNYDVFDEQRYFTQAKSNTPVSLKISGKDLILGIEICEDLWDENSSVKITGDLARQGCDLIVNLSASPFTKGKREIRQKLILDKVEKWKIPFVYVNMVGGQDELVFDGNSLGYDANGKLIGWGGEFIDSLNIFDIDIVTGLGEEITLPVLNNEESVYNALVTGVRDYLKKSGFSKAVIGLSGGVDSALVACMAADALGAGNVLCISMPSRFSSSRSIKDAEELASSLKIELKVIPIEGIVQLYEKNLSELFMSLPQDITEENIQARVRGNILMAVSNKFKYLVLSTGNKTELALGYCTLYGDMTGGLAVISDVSKLEVYALANYVNRKSGKEDIPRNIINKVPSAELAENQVDPFDYKVVSPLVDYIINEGKSQRELVEMGFPETLVKDISKMIRNAEYKRRQAAPGIKITQKAFGTGRRFPIINHFNER